MVTEALPATAEYALHHVWSTGTDADTSAYDDVTERYITPPGIVIDGIGRAETRAFGPPNTPALDDTLANDDRLYSPGGILGLFVGRGPVTTCDATIDQGIPVNADYVLVNADDVLVNGGVTERLFTGRIHTAPQQIDRDVAQVQIRSLGSIATLLRTKPVIALQENIRTDQAITAILDAVGWDADLREIDEGDTDLLYFWASGDTDALTLIRRILGAEGVPSCAYEDGDGTFHFEGRQFRADNRSTVQWTFTDTPTDLDGGAILAHIRPAAWASNPDEVVGQVTATVNVRTPTSTQKIWEYGTTLTLTNNETRDIEVSASDPFKSAVTPVAATDYTVSAGSLSSVTLLATSGTKVTLRLVAGASGATVLGVTSNGIQVRAVSLPVTTTLPIVNTVDIDLSAARYDPKDHALDLWPEVEPNQALDLANNFARRYQRPRDQMTVRIVNLDPYHLHAILAIRVSDRARIVHTHGVIDQEFYVESLHHDLSQGNGLHRLTLACEKVTDDIAARYGEAQYGFANYSE